MNAVLGAVEPARSKSCNAVFLPSAFESTRTDRWEVRSATDRYFWNCLEKEEAPRVSELARLIGLSRATLTERFHAATGSPPSDYLKARQIDASVALLINTDLSVAAIAYRLGFGTRRTFQRQFEARIGQAPSFFRESGRNVATAARQRRRKLLGKDV
jgi:AraC-like DNA-binding protein